MDYSESPWRYCILLVYSLLAIVVGLSFSGYAAISPQVQQLYGISVAQSNLISSAYATMSLILIVPSVYVLAYLPVRLNILLVVFVTILGSWIRCLINVHFLFAAIGQYIFAASFVFMRSIVTRISSIWFRPQRRSLSTSIMYTVLFTSDLLSLFLPVLFVEVDVIPTGKEQFYKKQLFNMHIVQAVYTTLFGLIAVLFFRQKPASPVSPTAVLGRTQFTKTLKDLFNHRDFIFLTLFSAITDTMLVAFRLVMRDAFSNYGITSNSIALFSLISVPLTIGAITYSGYLAGAHKQFKTILVAIGFLILALLILLIPLKNLKSPVVFGIIQILFQISGPPSASLCYELAAQISYPVSQGFSSSFLNFFYKLTTVSMVQLSSLFIENNSINWLLTLYAGLQAIACALILFVKEKHARRNKDIESMELTMESSKIL